MKEHVDLGSTELNDRIGLLATVLVWRSGSAIHHLKDPSTGGKKGARSRHPSIIVHIDDTRDKQAKALCASFLLLTVSRAETCVHFLFSDHQ